MCALSSQVASVNEDVSIWDVFWLVIVSVRDAYDTNLTGGGGQRIG